MSYAILADGQRPALVIYLLDVSASMEQKLGDKTRIEVAQDALTAALRRMISHSTKGSRLSPRYRIAMFAYSDRTHDLLGGIKSIAEVANKGTPRLSTMSITNTAGAFKKVEELLKRELPNLTSSPAPLVCHLTDGMFNGEDPEPIVQRIKQMRVPDGHVLVENIFISDTILTESIPSPYEWPGVRPNTVLANQYATKLRAMSSPLPASYRAMMQEMGGYNMAQDAVMMLPGISPQLVKMGFVMSSATPTA